MRLHIPTLPDTAPITTVSPHIVITDDDVAVATRKPVKRKVFLYDAVSRSIHI